MTVTNIMLGFLGLLGTGLLAILFGSIRTIFLSDMETHLKGILVNWRTRRRRNLFAKAFLHAIAGWAPIQRANGAIFSEALCVFGMFALWSFNTMIMVSDTTYGKALLHKTATSDQFDWIVLIGALCATLCLMLYFLYVVVWKWRFVRLTQVFAFEFERFMSRMQVIATKEEILELAKMEVDIRNDVNLMMFVTKAHSIAKRHDATHLLKSFDLWNLATD